MSALHQCLDKALQLGHEGRLQHGKTPGLHSRAQLIDQDMQALCIFPTLRFARLALLCVLA
nr:hypothetical protein [Dechloromonas sp.]